MKKLLLATVLVLALAIGWVTIVSTQPHTTTSLLLHLDLELDKSILGDTQIQVRVHAQDRFIDTYFASPVDLSDGDVLVWQQDLPLMVDSNMPLRLTFEIQTVSGFPLPSAYRVQAQYSVNGGAYRDLLSNMLTVPAGYSGDADLAIRGTVVSR